MDEFTKFKNRKERTELLKETEEIAMRLEKLVKLKGLDKPKLKVIKGRK